MCGGPNIWRSASARFLVRWITRFADSPEASPRLRNEGEAGRIGRRGRRRTCARCEEPPLIVHVMRSHVIAGTAGRASRTGAMGLRAAGLAMPPLLLLLLLLAPAKTASARDISRRNGAAATAKVATLELTAETFNASLWAAPATFAVVEFYAHWCPACQHFKPQYERVAGLFNGLDAVYPGVLVMARVDCAEEINRNLCQRFAVQQYPTILWGKPDEFAWGGRGRGKADELELIRTRMVAQSLLDWINSRLKASYSLDKAVQMEQLGKEAHSVVGQPTASFNDIETATAEAFAIILDDKLVTSQHRGPFVHFLQLLTVHHPSKRCRAGSAQILLNLMDAWPAEHNSADVDDGNAEVDGLTGADVADIDALRQFHICGEAVVRGNYKSCSMRTGGYSCGLWYLFHALSVRVDDLESGGAMKAISEFVANFFTCEECREHFMQMSTSAVDKVSSARDLALWLWRAHNEVNSRLARKEVQRSAGLPSSKALWPSKEVCQACRRSSEKLAGFENADEEETVEWDEDQVYRFLRKVYGRSLRAAPEEVGVHVSSEVLNAGHGVDESTSSSSIAAPAGAALGIAMACGGFGLAACCWRLQQKKRKRMRRRA